VRRPGTTSLAEQIVLAVELLRVLSVLAVVEKSRTELGIEPAVAVMRERGGRSIHRDPARRVQLQRAIGWVDARMSGGANCYRRVLLELALDSGASSELVRVGVCAKGGRGSGHAWLGARSAGAERYDLELTL
jgi:hypothetical protein